MANIIMRGLNMEQQDIKSSRLIRLMKASQNAGGELFMLMQDALNGAKNEEDFEYIWFFNINNFTSRVISFRNVLAERQGYDQIIM